MELMVNRVIAHYQFRLRVARNSRTGIPRQKRLFWVRGPQEAIDHAKDLLGISGELTSAKFRKAGGVFIKKIVQKTRSFERGGVVYPF